MEKPAAAAKVKAGPGEIRKFREHVGQLEKRVVELEARQAEITAALEAPETYADKGKFHHLNRELSTIVDQITTATAEWEAAAGGGDAGGSERILNQDEIDSLLGFDVNENEAQDKSGIRAIINSALVGSVKSEKITTSERRFSRAESVARARVKLGSSAW